jgi:hypothetical protein
VWAAEGGLLDEEAVGVAHAMAPRPGPELAHGSVVETQALLGVDGHRMGAAAFGVNQESVAMSAVTEQTVVVVDGQVPEGPSEVMQEAVAFFAAVDDPAREDGQPRFWIVAAAALKLLRQRRGPIGDLHFPAVGMKDT